MSLSHRRQDRMAAPKVGTTYFKVNSGKELQINAFEDAYSVLASAWPPMILQCISKNNTMLVTFHIIYSAPAVVYTRDYIFRVINPLCNGETSTLTLTPDYEYRRRNMMTREKIEEALQAEVGPSRNHILLTQGDLKARLQEERKHEEYAEIDIRLCLLDRAKLFSKFDKLTINFFLGECLFFQYILSMGQDFHLLVHESYNVSGNDAMPRLIIQNPWPFGAKQIQWSLKTTYGTV